MCKASTSGSCCRLQFNQVLHRSAEDSRALGAYADELQRSAERAASGEARGAASNLPADEMEYGSTLRFQF